MYLSLWPTDFSKLKCEKWKSTSFSNCATSWKKGSKDWVKKLGQASKMAINKNSTVFIQFSPNFAQLTASFIWTYCKVSTKLDENCRSLANFEACLSFFTQSLDKYFDEDVEQNHGP